MHLSNLLRTKSDGWFGEGGLGVGGGGCWV